MDLGNHSTCVMTRPRDRMGRFDADSLLVEDEDLRRGSLSIPVWRTDAAFADSISRSSRLGGPAPEDARTVEDEPVTVLLVDDDVVDVMAIRRSFRQLGIDAPLVVAGNGIEALEILRGENGREKVMGRFVILLNLNMPRMGGIEFLRELRADPMLRRALVFVMTTSAAEKDRARAYDLNVAGYVLKQHAGQGFMDLIAMLESYWQVIEFPHAPGIGTARARGLA